MHCYDIGLMQNVCITELPDDGSPDPADMEPSLFCKITFSFRIFSIVSNPNTWTLIIIS